MTSDEATLLYQRIDALAAEVRGIDDKVDDLRDRQTRAEAQREASQEAMVRIESNQKAHQSESNGRIDAIERTVSAKLDAIAAAIVDQRKPWSSDDWSKLVKAIGLALAGIAAAAGGGVGSGYLLERDPSPPAAQHSPVPEAP